MDVHLVHPVAGASVGQDAGHDVRVRGRRAWFRESDRDCRWAWDEEVAAGADQERRALPLAAVLHLAGVAVSAEAVILKAASQAAGRGFADEEVAAASDARELLLPALLEPKDVVQQEQERAQPASLQDPQVRVQEQVLSARPEQASFASAPGLRVLPQRKLGPEPQPEEQEWQALRRPARVRQERRAQQEPEREGDARQPSRRLLWQHARLRRRIRRRRRPADDASLFRRHRPESSWSEFSFR